MHEWAVAKAVAATVRRAAKGKVRRVIVSVPLISFLDVDLIKEAYSSTVRGTPLEGSKLEVKVRDVKFKCLSCGLEFSSKDVKDQIEALKEEFGEDYPLHMFPSLAPALLKCPACGSHDLDITGSEIRLEGIELDNGNGVTFVKVKGLMRDSLLK